jgi:hypothetical protein
MRKMNRHEALLTKIAKRRGYTLEEFLEIVNDEDHSAEEAEAFLHAEVNSLRSQLDSANRLIKNDCKVIADERNRAVLAENRLVEERRLHNATLAAYFRHACSVL